MKAYSKTILTRFAPVWYNIVMKKLFVALLAVFVVFAGFSQEEDWYMGKIIEDISFTGLVNVPLKELTAITDTYKGEVFTYDLIMELQRELYGLDYFESLNISLNQAGKQSSDGVIIHFTVTEFPKFTGLFFEGNSFFKEDRLLSFAKKAGYDGCLKDPLNRSYCRSVVAFILEEIRNAYINRGFLEANVELIENSGTYTYRISEGYQFVIEAVNFKGNNVISSEELRQCLLSRSRGVFNSGLARMKDFWEDVDALLQYYHEKGYERSMKVVPDFIEGRVEGNICFVTLTYIITQEKKR